MNRRSFLSLISAAPATLLPVGLSKTKKQFSIKTIDLIADKESSGTAAVTEADWRYVYLNRRAAQSGRAASRHNDGQMNK